MDNVHITVLTYLSQFLNYIYIRLYLDNIISSNKLLNAMYHNNIILDYVNLVSQLVNTFFVHTDYLSYNLTGH